MRHLAVLLAEFRAILRVAWTIVLLLPVLAVALFVMVYTLPANLVRRRLRRGIEPDGVQHPRPWWYSVALRIVPKRCREIPEADNPTWCEHRNPVKVGDMGCKGDVNTRVGWCRDCGAPPRILLRQVAIRARRWYLQQFACSEDPRYMHSHPARLMLVLGLWGSYVERKIAGAPIERHAPYVYAMDRGHVHHVQRPAAGHTSLFLMFDVQHDTADGDKQYFGAPVDEGDATALGLGFPATITRPWRKHIRRQVARV